jgi:pyruvate ferredoxin oxidoreductase gamma subunit
VFETRIHGRGGQGVVTAAEMLSVAAFSEGKFSQAFPTFGSERMGAPVVSFCRWDDKPIRLREPIRKPNALIIQDASLMNVIDVFEGFDPAGFLLINSSRSFEELELTRPMDPARHVIVPASSLALRYVGKPLPNACLLGAFAAITQLLKFDSVLKAIRERFPGRVGAANEQAARAAYEIVLERQGAPCVETA